MGQKWDRNGAERAHHPGEDAAKDQGPCNNVDQVQQRSAEEERNAVQPCSIFADAPLEMRQLNPAHASTLAIPARKTS